MIQLGTKQQRREEEASKNSKRKDYGMIEEIGEFSSVNPNKTSGSTSFIIYYFLVISAQV
jgi:hypothetical protein